MSGAAPPLRQVAAGGDTGDDAGQGRVLAGSALLYSPLTNRVNHCCLGPGGEHPHPRVWLHLNTNRNGSSREIEEPVRKVRAIPERFIRLFYVSREVRCMNTWRDEENKTFITLFTVLYHCIVVPVMFSLA